MWRAIVRYFQRLGLYLLLLFVYISGGLGNGKTFKLMLALVAVYVSLVLGLNWKYRKAGKHSRGGPTHGLTSNGDTS